MGDRDVASKFGIKRADLHDSIEIKEDTDKIFDKLGALGNLGLLAIAEGQLARLGWLEH